MIYKLGYDRNTTINKNFIKSFYSHLSFVKRKVTQLDKGLLELNNLRFLDASRNQILVLENIPITIEELVLSRN